MKLKIDSDQLQALIRSMIVDELKKFAIHVSISMPEGADSHNPIGINEIQERSKNAEEESLRHQLALDAILKLPRRCADCPILGSNGCGAKMECNMARKQWALSVADKQRVCQCCVYGPTDCGSRDEIGGACGRYSPRRTP